MDTGERIHLISAKTDAEVEVHCILSVVVSRKIRIQFYLWYHFCQVLDLKQVELVYGSSFFKSIETGGNVSKALVKWIHVQSYNYIVSSFNMATSCYFSWLPAPMPATPLCLASRISSIFLDWRYYILLYDLSFYAHTHPYIPYKL